MRNVAHHRQDKLSLTLQMSSFTAMCLSAEQSGAASCAELPLLVFSKASSAAAAPSCARVRAFWNDLRHEVRSAQSLRVRPPTRSRLVKVHQDGADS